MPEVDLSHRMLHHRMVNIEEVQRRERKRVAVSRNWKLIKVEDGQTTVLAPNVLWFALDESGKAAYTDGYAIYDSSGARVHEADGLITGLGIDHSSHG